VTPQKSRLSALKRSVRHDLSSAIRRNEYGQSCFQDCPVSWNTIFVMLLREVLIAHRGAAGEIIAAAGPSWIFPAVKV